MEFATQIIDTSLLVLVNGFSIMFISVFLLEIQEAWVNHCPSTVIAAKVGDTVKVEVKVGVEVKVENEAQMEVEKIYPLEASSIPETVIPIRKPVLVKDNNAISASTKSKSKIKVDLRQQCEKAGVEWRFARTNTQTNRKRHLTEAEMISALNVTA